MFKKGFTLAEILIALTTIGIIAAITLPTFVSNTTTAQIGPKLAKAVSMFEQANVAMLNEKGVDIITDIVDIGTPDNYWSLLSNHLMGVAADGRYYTKDGMTLIIQEPDDTQPYLADFRIDINGESGPSIEGTDMFTFVMYNDGSLRPKGGIGWLSGQTMDMRDCTEEEKAAEENNICTEGKTAVGANDRDGGSEHWKSHCEINSLPENAEYCAGHIFENNLKVLYK